MVDRIRYEDTYIVRGLKGEYQGLYKIGRTRRLESRLEELQNQFGPVELVMIIRSSSFETRLHRAFSDKQITVNNSREWFKLDREDLIKVASTASMKCLLEWVDYYMAVWL